MRKSTNPATNGAAATTPYDRLTLWINPSLADLATPTVAERAITVIASTNNFTQIGIRTANLTGTSDFIFMDRIKLCTQWDCIVGDDNGPLFVSLESFTATGRHGGPATIRWTTGSEIDNAGFHVYRSTPQGMSRLTSTLLAPLGDEFAGATYEFLDNGARASATMPQYYLEDIDFSGLSTLHGPAEQILLAPPAPVKASPRAPIRINDGRLSSVAAPIEGSIGKPAEPRPRAD
jgi:hypothetical protein